MEGLHYPSDLSDEQWQVIELLVPPRSRVDRSVDALRGY